jgi:ribosomal protein L18
VLAVLFAKSKFIGLHTIIALLQNKVKTNVKKRSKMAQSLARFLYWHSSNQIYFILLSHQDQTTTVAAQATAEAISSMSML